MGIVEPYQTSNPADGRSAVTGADAYRFSFKVPTLRNIELTYPYSHDGAADTLAKAVDVMVRLQLGKRFTPEQNANIVAFLNTPTGEQRQILLPILSSSSDKTPRPQPFAASAAIKQGAVGLRSSSSAGQHCVTRRLSRCAP